MEAEDRLRSVELAGDLAVALARCLGRPIAAETREQAARHVLDWVACAVAGRHSELGDILGGYAEAAAPGPVHGIGVGRRAFDAALMCNGSIGDVLRMSDFHRTLQFHPGTVVIPAALAAGEACGAAPATFLDAVVHGYEVAIAVAARLEAEGVNRTATAGRYGAAAAAAHVIGLDDNGVAEALRLAASLVTLGEAEAEDAPARHFQNAEAALGGARAALLAAHGLTGPARAMDGPRGLLALAGGDAGTGKLPGDRDPWRIGEVAILPWGSCHHAHAAIDAALALRDQVAPDEVREVRVWTYEAALDSCDLDTPRSLNEARYSLQHAVAVALYGGPPELADFSPARCGEAPVAALRDKVRLMAAERFSRAWPEHCGAAAEVEMADGRTLAHEVADARGGATRPLSIDEHVAKARELLAWSGCMEAAEADRLIEATLYLPDAASLASFIKALP